MADIDNDIKQIHFSGYGKFTNTTYHERYTYFGRKPHYSVDDTEHKATLSLVKIVFSILLIAVVFGALVGSMRTITFTGFLEWIKNYHPLFQNVSVVSNTIGGTWGLLDGFRVFFNTLITIADFFVYLCKSLLNIISYITGFFGFLFGA